MTQKYILTGGPGSGKSSINLELELRGEYTIREAAEDIIKRSQAGGDSKPWEKPDFQERILNLQILREQRIPSYTERAFIDRGIPDGLAYAQPGSETQKRILESAPRYDGIFLIENLGSTDTNQIRREDQSAALELERKLDRVYSELGYRVHKIGKGTVAQRADRILEIIAQNQKLKGGTLE